MPTYQIIQGTVFDALPTIKPGSIDACVTSPPYWALRSYLPDEHPLKSLELGQEKTPGEYIANAVRWCGLVRDCLADHGTLWLNIGDSYSHDSRGGKTGGKHAEWHGNPAMSPRRAEKMMPVPAGNLCLIPQRLAIALQEDGWIVRSVIVWRKPAAMPDSITGWFWERCQRKVKSNRGARDIKANKATGQRAVATFKDTRTESGAALSAEGQAEWEDCPGCKKCSPNGGYVLCRGSWRPTSSWEPILMLAKTADYYADGEPTKTPPAHATVERDRYTRIIDDPDEQFAVEHNHETFCDGAKLRDVWREDLAKLTKEQLIAFITENMDTGDCWTIPFEPLRAKHYAAYPSELVHKCLVSSVSQEGYCDQCGKPFVRVVEQEKGAPASFNGSSFTAGKTRVAAEQLAAVGTGERTVSTRTTGWRPSCKCVNPTARPGRVLDPFCGSGRTGIAAARLGLDFVGVELNPDFVAMGEKLIQADAPLFNERVDAA